MTAQPQLQNPKSTIQHVSRIPGLQNPKSKIQNLHAPSPHGQTIIEMVIAVTGIVMFIYVFTRIWTWTSGTIVQRQEAFQATRLAAGQPDCAGAAVGYRRPPL